MTPYRIKRVRVWSGGIRAAHWLVAACTLVLLATGWVQGSGLRGDLDRIVDLHVAAGYLLIAALVFRLYRLFAGPPADRWRDLLPDRAQRRLAGAVARYYLSWTRAPMPSYYAHNPLWGPVYLLALALLMAQAGAGLMLHLADGGGAFLAGPSWIHDLPLREFHRGGFHAIAAFAVAHLIAVFLHDWKGGGGEVSAMISGYKTFNIDRPAVDLSADHDPKP